MSYTNNPGFARDIIGRFSEKPNSTPEVDLLDDLTDFMTAPEPLPLAKGQPVVFEQPDGVLVPSEVVEVDGGQVWLRSRRAGEHGVWVTEDRYVHSDRSAPWDASRAEADRAAYARTDAALDAADLLTSDQVNELSEAHTRLNDSIYLGDTEDGSVPADAYAYAVGACDDAIAYADAEGYYVEAFARLHTGQGTAFTSLRRSTDGRVRAAGWLVVAAVEAELVRDLAFDDDYPDFTPEQYDLLTRDFKRVTGIL